MCGVVLVLPKNGKKNLVQESDPPPPCVRHGNKSEMNISVTKHQVRHSKGSDERESWDQLGQEKTRLLCNSYSQSRLLTPDTNTTSCVRASIKLPYRKQTEIPFSCPVWSSSDKIELKGSKVQSTLGYVFTLGEFGIKWSQGRIVFLPENKVALAKYSRLALDSKPFISSWFLWIVQFLNSAGLFAFWRKKTFGILFELCRLKNWTGSKCSGSNACKNETENKTPKTAIGVQEISRVVWSHKKFSIQMRPAALRVHCAVEHHRDGHLNL